ncbi:cofactor-independent phosphoglycerate mutase [Methanospirillum lacunae]|uniref:phosphoglycerate mutase (2,3-diphosphoglycerate-independent) n=1 Tax=Methanospirillum lacunae TaxID=668570 RepID=A0A2V2MZT3_9EURY|nr:cofactor-independent phosphoglycerate mutase [Methanospirillum lacunae]PWR72989.1 cofactor-independent phosphoglycerate mutase [Methanospirillum lacunae]
MKYLIVLGDGMADEPIAELGGKTPLEVAETPFMDQIAREGAMGLLKTVPDGYQPGSDIANLGVLGYDVKTCYTGRGALEAASMGIDLGPADMAYRCNLVTITDGVMTDFSAGHISSEEGAALLESLNEEIIRTNQQTAIFYPGVSYRNLMVIPSGGGVESTPPHDIVDQKIETWLPKGPDCELILTLMEISSRVFADHPVNRERIAAGKKPVTHIWPWSSGKRPEISHFSERWGISGGMISAVDLLNGIAKYAGMEIIRVPGATGFLDTDYNAKARYTINALRHLDFLYLHVEAPDEAGHMGDLKEKILAIERVDAMLGTIMEEFDGRIAVLPDHPTPIRVKTHTMDPVPFAIRGIKTDGCTRFSETEAVSGGFGTMKGTDLLPLLLS